MALPASLPTRVDFYIGDPLAIVLVFVGQDLTSKQFASQIRSGATIETVLQSFTIAVLLVGGDTYIVLSLTGDSTLAVNNGQTRLIGSTSVFDIEMANSSGALERTIIRGELSGTADITRASVGTSVTGSSVLPGSSVAGVDLSHATVFELTPATNGYNVVQIPVTAFVSDLVPKALGTAAAGTSSFAMRADAVLPLPTGAQVRELLEAATVSAKGDLLVYNGTDFVRLPIGANGKALIADSSTTTGLAWATVTTSASTGATPVFGTTFGSTFNAHS